MNNAQGAWRTSASTANTRNRSFVRPRGAAPEPANGLLRCARRRIRSPSPDNHSAQRALAVSASVLDRYESLRNTHTGGNASTPLLGNRHNILLDDAVTPATAGIDGQPRTATTSGVARPEASAWAPDLDPVARSPSPGLPAYSPPPPGYLSPPPAYSSTPPSPPSSGSLSSAHEHASSHSSVVPVQGFVSGAPITSYAANEAVGSTVDEEAMLPPVQSPIEAPERPIVSDLPSETTHAVLNRTPVFGTDELFLVVGHGRRTVDIAFQILVSHFFPLISIYPKVEPTLRILAGTWRDTLTKHRPLSCEHHLVASKQGPKKWSTFRDTCSCALRRR